MRHVYISSRDKAGGIYHYTFDRGAFAFCEKTELDRPTYAVIDGNGIYILLQQIDENTRFGGLVRYELSADGRLIDPSPVASTCGVDPCHLCVAENDVYAVNYGSGNVVRFPDRVVTHIGSSVHPQRQTRAHTHCVVFSEDRQYVLCTDLGMDTVFVYDRDLRQISSAKVPAGSGCRHLRRNGNLFYCVNELSGDVSVFSLNNGVLTLRGTYAALTDGAGESYAAAVRMYENRLYISHRGADCISCFAVRGAELSLLWNAPCGGHYPRDFAVVDGYVICANEGGNVALFRLLDDGLERLPDPARMPDPLCVTVR